MEVELHAVQDIRHDGIVLFYTTVRKKLFPYELAQRLPEPLTL